MIGGRVKENLYMNVGMTAGDAKAYGGGSVTYRLN
jgi:hypothetical protein